MNINWVEKLPKEIEEKMVQGYIAYEHEHGIDVNFKTFSLILQDDHENVCGVLNAYTAFSEIYVQDIWVDKAFRGQGYGRKLLLALEEHYKGKGFNNSPYAVFCTSELAEVAEIQLLRRRPTPC